jgi:hypothetical protein
MLERRMLGMDSRRAMIASDGYLDSLRGSDDIWFFKRSALRFFELDTTLKFRLNRMKLTVEHVRCGTAGAVAFSVKHPAFIQAVWRMRAGGTSAWKRGRHEGYRADGALHLGKPW